MLVERNQGSRNDLTSDKILSKVDWAKRLERIEKIKADKRQKQGVALMEDVPQGKTRDIVGNQSGLNGKTQLTEIFP